MKYTFSIDAPQQQYIAITFTFSVTEKETEVCLPTWRPGRYQVGDFAKNIKTFQVFDDQGKKCTFHKTEKSKWLIDTANTKSVKIVYKYYANQMNAGSTFLDQEQLYVNPVNCCLYVPLLMDEKAEVELNIPKHWKYAGPLEMENNNLTAVSFDELADSPFICSAGLQHQSYKVNDVTFHVWFNGIIKPDWDKLIPDFEAFTAKQLEKFIEFPTDEYHFLFQILPYKAYHGVEHERCTVITLGPSYAVFKSFYKELLGVSSHELYHTWNVKAIRPKQMYPYDFSKENYTHLGYITEGVTTYQGDLMLLKSGVFSLEQYLNEFNVQLQKHFDNFGRFNYSVAESSFDTWLDGYEAGAPGRKVSIYTEGCLLAFVVDVLIMKASDNSKSLDDVMRNLYFNFAQKQQGITKEDFQNTIENCAGRVSFDWLFDQYYYGTKAYEIILTDCLEYLGLELNHAPSDDAAAAYLGLKTQEIDQKTIVQAIYPGSPSDLAGVTVGDEVIALNDVSINSDLPAWTNYFENELKSISVLRMGRLITFSIPQMDRPFYQKYWVTVVDQSDKSQQNALKAWMK